ncbi:ComEA family DNA-binding protein [Streptomyces sp. NPDC053755]|uniref:ComEA family DNA-binding protein n=1 Tax=Streptomyces sp. NPDC053755 TaxID=3155815 RepID=UPI003440D68B
MPDGQRAPAAVPRARTSAATSGPGREPGSDGRFRGGGRGTLSGRAPRRVRRRHALAAAGAAVRERGEALFPHAGGPGPADPPAPAVVAAPAVEPERRERPERAGPRRRERWALALGERLPLWAQSRCGLEPRALVALAVVLLVAAGLAGRHYWAGRPEAVRAPEFVRTAPLPESGASPPSTALPAPTSGAPPSAVVVDVGGKVLRPGVLTLPSGSRVADALRAAGGVRPGTDVTGLNRARVLMDGEQVVVGLPTTAGGGPVNGSLVGGGAGGGSVAGTRAMPLSLNAATVEQLDTLPGVGPVLAQHIVDHRVEHGGFRSVAELREVNGIGERRFADLEPLVRP